MLLATALCGVVLAALWMLMGTYSALFDKGQRQVERAQLCRALLEQMADDLRCAIQDPLPGPAADATSGTAQRRRFGLFGSSRELRFDVLQLTPNRGNLVPVGRTAGLSAETSAARVPELHTVHYTFSEPDTGVEPSAGDDVLAPPRRGLVRSELDFETPLDASGVAGSETGESTDFEPTDDQGSPVSADDDSRLWVPEVVGLQIRYFDGRGWTDAWNSLERKSLPAAVEIQLQLADAAAGADGRRAEAGVGGPDGQSYDDAGAAEDVFSDAEPGLEPSAAQVGQAPARLVVDLPGSPNYRPPPVEPQPELLPPVRPPVRRVVPPRRTQPAQPAPLPEDWIRTGSR